MSLEYLPPVADEVASQLNKPQIPLVSEARQPEAKNPWLDIPPSDNVPPELGAVSFPSRQVYQIAQNYQSCARTSNNITAQFPSPGGNYDGFWSQFLNAQIQNGFCLNNNTVKGLHSLYSAFGGDLIAITKFIRATNVAVDSAGRLTITELSREVFTQRGSDYGLNRQYHPDPQQYRRSSASSFLNLNFRGGRVSGSVGGTTHGRDGGSTTIIVRF